MSEDYNPLASARWTVRRCTAQGEAPAPILQAEMSMAQAHATIAIAEALGEILTELRLLRQPVAERAAVADQLCIRMYGDDGEPAPLMTAILPVLAQQGIFVDMRRGPTESKDAPPADAYWSIRPLTSQDFNQTDEGEDS